MNIGRSNFELEFKNVESFLLHYCAEAGDEYSAPEYVDRPDFVVKSVNTGAVLGIEVTIAYLHDESNTWAKKFRNSEDSVFTPEDGTALVDGRLSRLDFEKRFGKGANVSEYLWSIETAIKKKISDSSGYREFDRLLLVIGIGDPLFGLTSLKATLRNFAPVPDCKFAEIWINVFENLEGDTGILRIR